MAMASDGASCKYPLRSRGSKGGSGKAVANGVGDDQSLETATLECDDLKGKGKRGLCDARCIYLLLSEMVKSLLRIEKYKIKIKLLTFKFRAMS